MQLAVRKWGNSLAVRRTLRPGMHKIQEGSARLAVNRIQRNDSLKPLG